MKWLNSLLGSLTNTEFAWLAFILFGLVAFFGGWGVSVLVGRFGWRAFPLVLLVMAAAFTGLVVLLRKVT